MVITDELLRDLYAAKINEQLKTPTVRFPFLRETEKKEVKVSAKRNVTVSAKGLSAFVADLISFLPTTRKVEKLAPETGRYYTVTEEIPTEELFTIVAIRPASDGKFVIEVENSMLDKLNQKKVRETKVTEYETL